LRGKKTATPGTLVITLVSDSDDAPVRLRQCDARQDYNAMVWRLRRWFC
jgi:hypothetical protein